MHSLWCMCMQGSSRSWSPLANGARQILGRSLWSNRTQVHENAVEHKAAPTAAHAHAEQRERGGGRAPALRIFACGSGVDVFWLRERAAVAVQRAFADDAAAVASAATALRRYYSLQAEQNVREGSIAAALHVRTCSMASTSSSRPPPPPPRIACWKICRRRGGGGGAGGS